MRVIKALFAVLAMLSVLGANLASADYLYRYKDNNGVTRIEHSIPPEYVGTGYEILNPDGSVREVVARELTPEEIAEKSSQIYKDKVAREERERLRKWDESLLLRYSSLRDIEAARERALSELTIRISILKSNVRSLKRQVENNQARAADIERSGGTVTVEIIDAIDGLQGEITETERSVVEREREKELVSQGFQRDMERFEVLLDKVELRKRATNTGD